MLDALILRIHRRVQIHKHRAGRHEQIECQHLENQLLHAQHLLLGVRVIGDVHELVHVRRIDLLVFAVPNKRNSVSVVRTTTTTINTHAAMNMAAVPTSCSFARTTDMVDRNRSMYDTARHSVSLSIRYSSHTSTSQSTRMVRID